MKKALITGITGQDGSYLAELLLDKGYEVHGIIRRSVRSTPTASTTSTRIRTSRVRLLLYYGDLDDGSSLDQILRSASSPTRSTTSARRATCASASTCPSTPPTLSAIGTLRLLEAIRELRLKCSLLSGVVVARCSARSPDAAEREDAVPSAQPLRLRQGLRATGMPSNYREAYGLFACNGILFNHESPAPRRDRS